jgi:CPA1 family monovalent cation:H+ antiporter
LPILIFQAALEIDIKLLWENIIPIGLLALPLMLVSAMVIAACVYYGIDHASGFPWMAAFITGALLSATDPAAVLALLKNANAPERLSMLLEGESLFNDATAVVMFSILIAIATGSQATGSPEEVLLRFVTVFFGGLTVGVLGGFVAGLMIKAIHGSYVFPLVSIVCVYATFLIAEDLLHFSGVMAVLASGLMVGVFSRKYKTEMTEMFWDFLAYIAEAMIFLLAGITIILSMFADRWLAIVIGIISILVARIIMIFGTFPILKILPGIDAVPLKQQVVLAWGGVRGTVTLALALSLPLTLDYWYTIQSIAYGVVLFTLFVQATTIGPLIRKLDIS